MMKDFPKHDEMAREWRQVRMLGPEYTERWLYQRRPEGGVRRCGPETGRCPVCAQEWARWERARERLLPRRPRSSLGYGVVGREDSGWAFVPAE